MKTEILRSDIELVTAQKPLPEGVTLLDVMARLDAVSKSEQIPAPLKHYLERRSYLKALEYLQDPETPHRI